MLLFAAVMCATYVGVAIERFHKTVAALCSAAVLVSLGLGLHLFGYVKIYDFLKEDLNIFGVIIGTGILVDVDYLLQLRWQRHADRFDLVCDRDLCTQERSRRSYRLGNVFEARRNDHVDPSQRCDRLRAASL